MLIKDLKKVLEKINESIDTKEVFIEYRDKDKKVGIKKEIENIYIDEFGNIIISAYKIKGYLTPEEGI